MSGMRRKIIRHLGKVPLVAGFLQRFAGCGFVTFCAHVVSDERLPHVRPLFSYRTPRQFEADLDVLLKTRRPLALDEVVAFLAEGRIPPADACLLTFDDGLREAGEIVAPILKRRGVPAVFFINSGFVDNKEMFFRHKAGLIIDALDRDAPAAGRQVMDILAMHGVEVGEPRRAVGALGHDRQDLLERVARSIGIDFEGFLRTRRPYLELDELRGLARDGFAIGAHSRSHPVFAALSYAAQRDEALSSIEFVRSNFMPKSLAFAFPFHDGGVSEQLFADMAAAGVGVSFGTAGLRRDIVPSNLHRIPAEDAASGIMDDITVACLKGAFYRLAGKGQIARPLRAY